MLVKPPLDELRETTLYARLSGLSAELVERIEVFLSKISPILASTVRFFPYYTRHDAHHGFRVIRRIAQILKPDCFKPGTECSLGATEIFLLIASAYAHDLGMAVFPGEESELAQMLSFSLDSGWETKPELQQYLRENHSKRGGNYVFAHAEDLKIPVNLVGQLDWMMKSHNLSIPELDKNLSNPPFAAEERVMDIRQLSIRPDRTVDHWILRPRKAFSGPPIARPPGAPSATIGAKGRPIRAPRCETQQEKM
jgi:hypothetical protein